MGDKDAKENPEIERDRALRMLSDSRLSNERFEGACAKKLLATDFSRLSANELRRGLKAIADASHLVHHYEQGIAEIIGQHSSQPNDQDRTSKFEALPDSHQAVLDTFTRVMLSGIDSVTDDMERKLKFSMWISAFAAAGLGATVFGAEKFVSSFPMATLIAIASLLFGVIISAVFHRSVNEHRSLGSSEKIDFMTQQVRILLRDSFGKMSIGSFMDKIRFIGAHDAPRRLEHQYSSQLRDRIARRKLIMFQPWLVVLGYSILIEISYLRVVLGA